MNYNGYFIGIKEGTPVVIRRFDLMGSSVLEAAEEVLKGIRDEAIDDCTFVFELTKEKYQDLIRKLPYLCDMERQIIELDEFDKFAWFLIMYN